MSVPLEEYALLGDCRSSALISKAGSIDWWCAPAFDSAACLTALLGDHRHGQFKIAPRSAVTATRRRYRGHTLVLETELECAEGAVRLIDFLLFDDDEAPTQLTRIVE